MPPPTASAPAPPRSVGAPLLGFALFVLAVALASVEAVRHARGLAFPSLFMDPFGSYSAVHAPSWSPQPPPLRFPDRLVALDGAPTTPRAVQPRLDALLREGRPAVSLTFARGATALTVTRTLRRVGPEEIASFWSLYVLVGALVAWSGMVVLACSNRAQVARAYAVWSVSAFTFLATFFDYHTSRRLVPLFSVSTVGVGLGFLLLAIMFPDPPRIASARLRALVAALVAASVALALVLVAAPRFGVDALPARMLASFYAPIAALALLVAVIARLARADAVLRRQLRATLLGMVAAPVFVCLGIVLATLRGTTTVHRLIPVVMPLVPLSIGYALIRHNILGTTDVLSRRLLVVPNVVVSALLATLLWLGLRTGSPRPIMELALPTFLSGGLFVAMVVLGHRAMGRWLFPASAHFRPTVQQLADQLATLDHRDTLRETLERTIALWLPTDRVRVLAPSEIQSVQHLPRDVDDRLQTGAHVWTEEDPWHRHLVVPMRSLGALRGVVVLAPKHHGALYTTEDLALLDTVASLGAVALHNAEILAQLDAVRRFELAITREDKRATLGLLGAELAHEVAHPLQLFRGLLRRAEREPLSPMDLEVGAEEIERLERLLANMRRLEAPPPKQEPVTLREPVERALRLLRDLLAERELTATCDVPADLVVLADRDALVQVFANLLRNGAQAAPRGGRVGVEVRRVDGAVVIDVWDDGPGVPEHLIPTLFHRWVTSKEGGSGLGLAVARNLVLNLRWGIAYHRERGRTVFRLSTPGSDSLLPASNSETTPE